MTPLLAILPLLAHISLLAEAGPINVQRASTSTAAAASTTSRASGDLQTYNSGLGGIFAPAVTKSGNYWYSSGQQYNFLVEALDGSCYKQMDQCQLKANQQGNTPFAVSDCNGWQIQACRSSGSGSASSSSSSSSASTSASKTSTASSSFSTAPASSAAASSSSSSSSSAAKSSSSSSASSAASSSSSTSSSTAKSSSSSAVSSSSSTGSASFTASSASPTATPTTVAAGNYQTFTGAAGGIAAPAVTRSGNQWVQSGSSYDSIYAALQQSCYAQASACSSSSGSFDKNVCWSTQVNSCLSNAQTASDSYSASAAAYSSSVASANFAAATQARTVAGDLQTFAGALGGIPAPAVTGSQYNWKVAGRSDNFYNLIDALSTSCYDQQNSVGAKGAASNWAYELSTDNIYNVQINACLNNARNVANNWSPNSSSSSVKTTAASSATSSSSSSAAVSPTTTVVAATSTSTSKSSTSASSASSSAPSTTVTSTSTSSTISTSDAAAAIAASSLAAAASSSAASVAAAASSSAASVSAAAASASSAAASASSAAAAAASSAAAALKAPAGWSAPSSACIAEGSRGRALDGATFASSDMTWQKCADFCDSKGYPIFGIEYSQECYCGPNLANGASLTLPSTNCNMKCGGSGAICGGPSALTVFVKDSVLYSGSLTSDLTTVKVTLPTDWAAASSTCIQEGSTGRALAGASYYDDNMTIGKCLAFCKTKGMQWAGIEYSRECFCGNDLVNGASLDRTGSCDMTCPGQPGTTCGGPSLLSLFKDSSLLYSLTQIGDWSKQGCIQEVAGRALNGASLVTNDMTLEKCTSFCSSKGFAFAGLEYATECYCGNSLANSATLSAFSTQCNMPCCGASGQICGGPNAITLYSTLGHNALVGA
ncbi:hypothetical protein IAT40_006617 [Kwoniella sp. CBS 6097]